MLRDGTSRRASVSRGGQRKERRGDETPDGAACEAD